MSCDNYPSKKDVEDFALNAKVINEFTTSDAALTPSAASDNRQKITLAEIWRQANEESVSLAFLESYTWRVWKNGATSISGSDYLYTYESGHAVIVRSIRGAVMGDAPDFADFEHTKDQVGLRDFGCVLDGVTDDTDAFMRACEWSRDNHKPIIETKTGTLLYSQTADFSADGAGLIWGGVTNCVLMYSGPEHTNAVRVDNGDSHKKYTVSDLVGEFIWGEVVTTATGSAGVVRQRYVSHDLEIQNSKGEITAGDVITGSKSGATARVLTIDDTVFGSSLQDIKLRSFVIKYNRTQSSDSYSRPLDWAECTGLYLSSFRNNCECIDVRVEGYRWGIYVKHCYLGAIQSTKTLSCWAGFTLDSEFNNAIFKLNSASRKGSHVDGSGWGLCFTSSYNTCIDGFDMEAGNGDGVIAENLRACSYRDSDTEGNGNSNRQLIISGLPGADFTQPNKQLWTKGFDISTVRWREDLGIEIRDGVHGVNVACCDFDATTLKSNSFIARVVGAFVENIHFDETNSYYGENDTYQPDVARKYRTKAWVSREFTPVFNLLSQPLDINNGNGVPVATLPDGATITQIDYLADVSDPPSLAGSFDVDLGLDANAGHFYLNDVVEIASGGSSAIYAAPFGLYKSKTDEISNSGSSGVVRARIGNNTAGSGKILIRVWYTLE